MEKTEERHSIVLENNGQKIFGILHMPTGCASLCPAVLFCHGLAGHKVGKFRLGVTLAEMLSKQGIASLRIDFRGSGDSEGHFSEMTLESEVSDGLLALKYLRSYPGIASERVGLFGRSVGGTVALMIASRTPVPSLGVWAPLFDGEQWKESWRALQAPNISEETRIARMRINGQVPGREFFNELFSLNMREILSEIETLPLLHIHGNLDTIIPPQHAQQFEQARKHAGGHTQFLRLLHSDHDFSHPQEQQQALERTCQWFCDTLG
jgi:dipeptidyl aminopeptidase/acylaminoacyl peptidase